MASLVGWHAYAYESQVTYFEALNISYIIGQAQCMTCLYTQIVLQVVDSIETILSRNENNILFVYLCNTHKSVVMCIVWNSSAK